MNSRISVHYQLGALAGTCQLARVLKEAEISGWFRNEDEIAWSTYD